MGERIEHSTRPKKINKIFFCKINLDIITRGQYED